jgi:hypothetical protein
MSFGVLLIFSIIPALAPDPTLVVPNLFYFVFFSFISPLLLVSQATMHTRDVELLVLVSFLHTPRRRIHFTEDLSSVVFHWRGKLEQVSAWHGMVMNYTVGLVLQSGRGVYPVCVFS